MRLDASCPSWVVQGPSEHVGRQMNQGLETTWLRRCRPNGSGNRSGWHCPAHYELRPRSLAATLRSSALPSASAYRCNVSKVGFARVSFSSRLSADFFSPDRSSISASERPCRSRSALSSLKTALRVTRILFQTAFASRASSSSSSACAATSFRAASSFACSVSLSGRSDWCLFFLIMGRRLSTLETLIANWGSHHKLASMGPTSFNAGDSMSPATGFRLQNQSESSGEKAVTGMISNLSRSRYSNTHTRNRPSVVSPRTMGRPVERLHLCSRRQSVSHLNNSQWDRIETPPP